MIAGVIPVNATFSSEDWPRFRDIAEPRMVCLHVGHGSGSKVFQSYLDNHPQIYMLPAYPLLYLYPHWRRWEQEMIDNWTWSAIIDVFCIQHASVIDPQAIPGHNGMTGLGENRVDSSAIDGKLFRSFLSHLLQSEPITSRNFILAVHYAYAFCRGEVLEQKRVLVYHIHVQAYVSKYLMPDFPDMLILGMVRNQLSNHHGRYAHSISGVQDQKLNRSDAIVLRRRNYYEVYRLLYHPSAPVRGADPANIRVVRIEDLHLHLEETMRAVADFFGIEFNTCQLESTFNGLKFWGDAVYQMKPMNKLNPRLISLDWQKSMASMDWFVIEGLFYDYHKAYGYPLYKYTADTWANRTRLFFSMLLPSATERREFLNYLKPSTFADFISACDAEGSGKKLLIDYSFNAYYRHRWGSEDLNLWKPRWYRRFVIYAYNHADENLSPNGAATIKIAARVSYVAVNVCRYVWAILSQPFWIIRRWPMSFFAFSRLVNKTFDLPRSLP